MALTRKMKRNGVAVLVVALIVFSIVLLWGDFQENYQKFINFKWHWLPVALILVFINFSLRELKWDFFRRRAGIEAPRLSSALIFFSGYSMCVSPGRIGELIKPLMYKEYLGKSLSRTIPLCFCERLTDLLGMVVICGATIYFFIDGVLKEAKGTGAEGGSDHSLGLMIIFLVATVILLAILIGLTRNRRLVHGVLNLFSGNPKLAGITKKVRRLYVSTYPLLTAYNLISMTLFAAFSWFFECWATYILSRYGLGIEQVSLLQVMFIFCISSIVGGLFFFLPGGLGGFEAVMATCYHLLGAPWQVITILCRLATLFFGVFVGVISILLATRHFHEAVHWDEFEHIAEDVEAEADPAEPKNAVN